MRFSHILLLALIAIPLSCIYPLYDGDPDVLEEQQSVWQYLKVFSLYQDRLSSSCGSMTPYDMFREINDSLGGSRYTEYLEDRQGGGQIFYPETVIDEGNMIPLPDSTVYVYIPEFSEKTQEFLNAYTYAISQYNNIIIDLRYNGGGYLSVAEYMIDQILPTGTEYIKIRRRRYNSKTRSGATVDEVSATTSKYPLLHGKNIAVLMNGYSASASEMVAVGVKDGLRGVAGVKAYLIGEKSYGKGIGQTIIGRANRKTLSITFMYISGLDGGEIGEYHKVGIEPDEVPDDVIDEAIDVFRSLLSSRHPLAGAVLAQSEAVLKDAYGSNFYKIPKDDLDLMLLDMSLELFCAAKMLEPNFLAEIVPEIPDDPDEGDEGDDGDDVVDDVDDGGTEAPLRKRAARSGIPTAAQLRGIAKNGAPKVAVQPKQPIGLIVTETDPLE